MHMPPLGGAKLLSCSLPREPQWGRLIVLLWKEFVQGTRFTVPGLIVFKRKEGVAGGRRGGCYNDTENKIQ